MELQKGTFTLRSAEALKAVEESAETDCLLRQKGKELRGRETLFFLFFFLAVMVRFTHFPLPGNTVPAHSDI